MHVQHICIHRNSWRSENTLDTLKLELALYRCWDRSPSLLEEKQAFLMLTNLRCPILDIFIWGGCGTFSKWGILGGNISLGYWT